MNFIQPSCYIIPKKSVGKKSGIVGTVRPPLTVLLVLQITNISELFNKLNKGEIKNVKKQDGNVKGANCGLVSTSFQTKEKKGKA